MWRYRLTLVLLRNDKKIATAKEEPDQGLCELFPNGLYIPGYRPGAKLVMEIPPEQLPRIRVPVPRVEVTVPAVPMPPAKWLLNPTQGQVII